MALGYEFDDNGQDRRPRTPFGSMLASILANQKIDPRIIEAALGGAGGGQAMTGSAASGLGPEALAMLNQYANQIQPAAASAGAAGAAGTAGGLGQDPLAGIPDELAGVVSGSNFADEGPLSNVAGGTGQEYADILANGYVNGGRGEIHQTAGRQAGEYQRRRDLLGRSGRLWRDGTPFIRTLPKNHDYQVIEVICHSQGKAMSAGRSWPKVADRVLGKGAKILKSADNAVLVRAYEAKYPRSRYATQKVIRLNSTKPIKGYVNAPPGPATIWINGETFAPVFVDVFGLTFDPRLIREFER